jgi:hypothetical protein
VHDDEETFYHRKLSSKKGIENDGDNDECNSKKRSMPSLELVGFDI